MENSKFWSKDWKSLMAAAAIAIGLSASAAAAEEVTIKVATSLPETHPFNKMFFIPWAEEMNKKGAGEFHFDLYFGTLTTSSNVWERVTSGVADIGWSTHGNIGLPFPRTEITALPLLINDNVAGSVALWRTFAAGLLDDEYHDVKVLGLVAFPVQTLHSKDQVSIPGDAKGMKIRAADRNTVQTVEALGGTPVSVPSTEMYQALSQGLISATITNWAVVGPFKLNEVSTYHLDDIGLGATPGFFIMNERAYDSLSENGKAILDENTGEVLSRKYMEVLAGINAHFRDSLTASGSDQVITALTDAQRSEWSAALAPRTDIWIEQTPNGQAIYDTFVNAYKAALKGK
tara:strand:+ start:8147 stop:9184 length:1038 start_codon:yes stop_codon:yes gene_type:complete